MWVAWPKLVGGCHAVCTCFGEEALACDGVVEAEAKGGRWVGRRG